MQIDCKYLKLIQESLQNFGVLQQKQSTILFRGIRNFFVSEQSKIRCKQEQNQKKIQNSKIVYATFKVFQRHFNSNQLSLFKKWKTLMLIHGTILFSYQKHMSQQVITFLLKQLQNVKKVISLRQTDLQKEKSFLNRSLDVIKRTFTRSKQKMKLPSQQVINLNQGSKQFINESIIQYANYLNKILIDMDSYYQLSVMEFNPQKSNFEIDQKLMVWRCINILKLQSKITKKFPHFNRFWPQTFKYTLCTINLLATDSMNLYYSISSFIIKKVKQLRQKYNIKLWQKSNLFSYQFKLKQLKQDHLIQQIRNMIEQICLINDGINYQFYGIQHYKSLQNVKIPKQYLKPDCQSFSVLYQLFQEIDKSENIFTKKEKKQKLFSLKDKKNIALGNVKQL